MTDEKALAMLNGLADLIEPALQEVRIRLGPNALAQLERGEEVSLSLGEYRSLALAAAAALVPAAAAELDPLEERLARALLVGPEPRPLVGDCGECDDDKTLTEAEWEKRNGAAVRARLRTRPKRFGDSPQTHDQLMEMREFFPRTVEGVRTANALMREGMVSVAQLRDTPLEQLVGTPDLASGRLAMIRALLEGE